MIRTSLFNRRLFLGGALLVSLVLLARPGAAQVPTLLDDPSFRQEARQGVDLLYDMEYEAADSIFGRLAEQYPRHPVGPFLGALTLWWQILTDLPDTSHDDAFYAAMDEVIARADRVLEEDPDHLDALYLKGAALGFRARLRANRSNWFRAVVDGKRAMNYVLEVAEMDPAGEDYYFGKGLYDYYAAAAPERYALARPVMWLLPAGNKERGIEHLRRTVENGFFVRTEAAYFLLQIFFLYEEDFQKSVHYARWLREHHPENAYFHLLEARVYLRWNEREDARRVLSEVIGRFEDGRTGYTDAIAEQAYYYMGRWHMRRGAYEEALPSLEKLTDLLEERSADTYYKSYGHLRYGMTLDALGRRYDAVQAYRRVLEAEDHQNAHDRAQTYLEEPYTGPRG